MTPRFHLGLAAFYQAKRDFFHAALAASRFQYLPSHAHLFPARAVRRSRTWRRRLLRAPDPVMSA